jgi:hypothetical protein
MKFLALLASDPATESVPGTPEWDADMVLYERFGEIAGPAILGGEAMDPTEASTVRAGGLVTAGPFAEGAEVVGGLYVLDVPSLDEAIELARQIPAARNGVVELRPMVEWFGPQGDLTPGLARYLALIWAVETGAEQPGTPEWEGGMAEHQRFGEQDGASLSAGGALHPSASATSVRVRDGEVLVTDGPFSETAEVVGGFYVLATATRAEAEEVAGRIPISTEGAVELLPIMELGG